MPVAEVARGGCVSARTVWKWLARYRAEGTVTARQRRWSSFRIAPHYQRPVSTVVTALGRARLNRLARLEPPRPVVRYEAARPGELLHLDVKKLGRIGRVGHRIHGHRAARVRARGPVSPGR